MFPRECAAASMLRKSLLHLWTRKNYVLLEDTEDRFNYFDQAIAQTTQELAT